MKIISKIMILILLFINILNGEEIKNEYNKKIINKIINNYKYKLPVYQNELLTLIGVYSNNNNNLNFEYQINYQAIAERARLNQIKEIDLVKKLFSKKVIENFKKEKLHKHLNKCYMNINKRNIFNQNLELKFRYYMGAKFYTEIKLNRKICQKYQR